MPRKATKIKPGQVFERLIAIKDVGRDKHGYRLWQFRCVCGKVFVCSASIVWRKRKLSCGCLHRELLRIANIKHGKKYTRVYNIWAQLKQRCFNKKHQAYKRYGGRGIEICSRWLQFENFLTDMGDPPSRQHTLDRVDNNNGYSKGNCRWATKKEQNRNARTNTNYTLGSKTQCLSAWAEDFRRPYYLIHHRVRQQNWSLARALMEPTHPKKHSKKHVDTCPM